MASQREQQRRQQQRQQQQQATATTATTATTANEGNEGNEGNDALFEGLTPEEAHALRTNPAAADAFYDEGLAYNLDEVAPESLTVSLYEYVDVPPPPPPPPPVDGDTRDTGDDVVIMPTRRLRRRRYRIETRVPMMIFNRMLAGRQRAMRARAAYLAHGGSANDGGDPMLQWMQEQVLAVWQLSDPAMTLDRLAEGLDFQQVQGLFARFFGELLRQQQSKASGGGNGSAA
ncbi:MAG: hypothetical protein IVW57_00190 [Ktedonobacterales bacterium]|nr:hypothetical protein [Ktedonobacterales bacterium]